MSRQVIKSVLLIDDLKSAHLRPEVSPSESFKRPKSQGFHLVSWMAVGEKSLEVRVIWVCLLRSHFASDNFDGAMTYVGRANATNSGCGLRAWCVCE